MAYCGAARTAGRTRDDATAVRAKGLSVLEIDAIVSMNAVSRLSRKMHEAWKVDFSVQWSRQRKCAYGWRCRGWVSLAVTSRTEKAPTLVIGVDSPRWSESGVAGTSRLVTCQMERQSITFAVPMDVRSVDVCRIIYLLLGFANCLDCSCPTIMSSSSFDFL